MDLIHHLSRETVFNERVTDVRRKTAEAVAITSPGTTIPDLDIQVFATSIWDQSLYKAWAGIIHDLVPNLSVIETQLASLGAIIEADEIMLFERTSFLVISSWTSSEGDRNPYGDRFERFSNILKTFKHSCSKFTGSPRNTEQLSLFELKSGTKFSMFIANFTVNTYILVCLPPGEARFNSARLNVAAARPWFKFLDGPVAAASLPSIGPSQSQMLQVGLGGNELEPGMASSEN
jgi:Ras-related GTP-binding protein A/B